MTDFHATASPHDAAHLSEADRHGLADDTLADERRAGSLAHLTACAACADDVARLTAFRARVAHLPPMPTPANASDATVDALWPAIRARIERGKVVPLDATATAASADGRVGARRTRLVAGLVAATVLAVALPVARSVRRAPAPVVAPATPTATQPLVMVADSASAYRQQVEALLEDLEMRRAMLRPSTAATFDRDLRLIDDAIAELTAALARDPNNPALRQLLAASYRQKRDLLERIHDAS